MNVTVAMALKRILKALLLVTMQLHGAQPEGY